MAETNWMAAYGQLKRTVMLKRQEGCQLRASEVREYSLNAERLEQDLLIMKTAAMTYELSASELARREVILDNLKNQIGSIRVIGGDLGPQTTKYESPRKKNQREIDDVMSPIMTSNRGLVQRQEDIMKMQDEALLDIGKGVDRLHQQALNIGEEAKLHVDIMDHIEGNVDDTTDRLREEAQHANDIRQKTQMCSMYVCIGVEILVIVIVGVLLLGR